MNYNEMLSRIQDAKDAIADLEAALDNSTTNEEAWNDWNEARDWTQQLEGAALDIIEALEEWMG